MSSSEGGRDAIGQMGTRTEGRMDFDQPYG